MNLDLLNLPWEIQVSLASGYAAYILAFTGLSRSQRTIDVAFITLVFGLLATAILTFKQPLGPVCASILAFVLTCVLGLVWRKLGMDLLKSILRWADISWSDDDPSALSAFHDNSQYPLSQIAVLLDDGTWLSCQDTSTFDDAPFGPCQIGPNGDVAMYLTHEEKAGQQEIEMKTVRDNEYGDRITYIPAGRIRQITFRHTKI